MQEEFNQFERNDIWELVSKASTNQVIGICWVFHHKYRVIIGNPTLRLLK